MESESHLTLEWIEIREANSPLLIGDVESKVVVSISNVGRAHARNLRLRIRAEILQDGDLPTFVETLEGLQTAKKVQDHSDSTLVNWKGDSIQGGASNVEFEFYPLLKSTHSYHSTFQGGLVNLPTVPELVTESRIGHPINVDNYPNKQREYHTLHTINRPTQDDASFALSLSGGELIEQFDDVEASVGRQLTEDARREVIDKHAEVVPLRMECDIIYETPDDGDKILQVMDRVFPAKFGVSEQVIFESGLPTRVYQRLDHPQTRLKAILYSNLTSE